MEPITAEELFRPVENDYAIGILRRIFGSPVDSLFGSTSDAGGQVAPLLTTVIGVLNIGVLIFCVIVFSYTIYSLVFNTANDGDPAGRETNTSTTFLRVGIGSMMLLPVAGGFSVVQIVVIQMLIWGSGFADTIWNKVADVASDHNTYTVSLNDTSDDFLTAGKFSEVYYNRLLGHLCMMHANRTSEALGTGSSPVEPVGPVTIGKGEYEPGIIQWNFSDGSNGVFGSRSGMCGSLIMHYDRSNVSSSDSRFQDSSATYAENLMRLASDASRTAGIQAVSALDADARKLAQSIFSGARTTEQFKVQILAAIDLATTNYKAGIQQGVGQNGQVSQLANSLLEVTKRDGWMFAAVWQRSLSSYNNMLNNLKNGISFETVNTVRPNSAAGVLGSIWPGAEERALFDATERDFAYVQAFAGTFEEAGAIERASSPTAIEEVNAASRAASWASPIQWTYAQMFGRSATEKTDHWRDPLLEIQDQGNAYTVGGALVLATAPVASYLAVPTAAGAGSLVGAPIAGAAVGYAASQVVDIVMPPIGYMLIILGMILGVLLPFLPFAYFLAGVIGWVVMAVEALIAAPLWCLLSFAPSRDGDFLGTNKQGLLLLVGVFLRPALMIVGLIVCYVLLRVGLDFITTVFSGLYMIMTPDQTWSNVLTAVGLMALYVIITFSLVTNCASTITGLGDSIMDWIGVRVSQLGRNTIATDIVATGNPMGQGADVMLRGASAVGKGAIAGPAAAISRFRSRGVAGPKA